MFEAVNQMGTWDATFWYIGFGATLFFVGQLVIMFVSGLDGGGDVDLDGDGDLDDGDSDAGSFKILTLKNIIGFLMGLGWGGLALHLEAGLSKALTLTLASVIGFGVMVLQSTVFWLMYKLHAPNEQSLTDVVGSIGKVYLEIPENGSGKVTLDVHGALRTLDATSEDGKAIKTNATVEVVRVVNDDLVVKQSK